MQVSIILHHRVHGASWHLPFGRGTHRVIIAKLAIVDRKHCNHSDGIDLALPACTI
jgi:hypothetical protein